MHKGAASAMSSAAFKQSAADAKLVAKVQREAAEKRAVEEREAASREGVETPILMSESEDAYASMRRAPLEHLYVSILPPQCLANAHA